ncbi:MAG: hypothetical protein GY838_00390 [bacterium]|nr:hypothetical protein [bacterium]
MAREIEAGVRTGNGLAVAAVVGVLAVRGVLLVAQLISHLGFRGALDEPLLELLQDAAVLEDLFCGGVLGQSVQDLVELVRFLLLGHGVLLVGDSTPWLLTQMEIHSLTSPRISV